MSRVFSGQCRIFEDLSTYSVYIQCVDVLQQKININERAAKNILYKCFYSAAKIYFTYKYIHTERLHCLM